MFWEKPRDILVKNFVYSVAELEPPGADFLAGAAICKFRLWLL
jgi:hypothetical protein